MAGRTLIPIQYLDRFHLFTDTSPAFVPADTVNGNLSVNDGYTAVEMNNTSGASRNVVFLIPAGIDVDLLAPSRTYTLPSNGIYRTGVFPLSVYGAELLYTASGSGVSIRPISYRSGV